MSKFQPIKPGGEIRVIAPSFSKSKRKNQRSAERAKERLENLGYKITFGKYLESQFHLGTANVEQRAEDFSNAFTDKNVKAVIAFTGGWSANGILPRIDWEKIRANPKPLIGFSDITVLLNAIYSKTGISGLLGPNFISLGKMTSWQYTLDNLNVVLQQKTPINLKRSQVWGARSRTRYKTKPWKVLHEGEAEGTILGGNLGTLYLLQGTEFQPSFGKSFILAAEDDDESGKLTAREFSRRLESILQLPNVRKNLGGVLIGRFQPGSRVKVSDIASIIQSKGLGNIPVVSGVDFGHTAPLLTLPIGGRARLSALGSKIELQLLDI